MLLCTVFCVVDTTRPNNLDVISRIGVFFYHRKDLDYIAEPCFLSYSHFSQSLNVNENSNSNSNFGNTRKAIRAKQ